MYLMTSNSGSQISNLASGTRPTKSRSAAITTVVILAVFTALVMISSQPAQAQGFTIPGREVVMYNFLNTPDGATPLSGLALYNGNFYGTTCFGGLYSGQTYCDGDSGAGGGTVYEVTPVGNLGDATYSSIYSFCSQSNCADGSNPDYAGVIFDQSGNMYGTTFNGGANGYGVVYELSPSGNGTWTEKVLYSFKNSPDGANPINGLVMDAFGNLYGTTFSGGSGNGDGTIFELSRSGNAWKEKSLANINTVGSGLTIDSSGNIYGTTYQQVFEAVSNGKGGLTPKILFTFNPNLAQREGSQPTGTLAVDGSGNIYGTTYSGGDHSLGAVYELVKGSTGYTDKLLCSFSNESGLNGVNPFAGVILDSAGNLYGTTTLGGQYNDPPGDGTVYELVAANKYQEIRTFSFDGESGAYAYGPLLLNNGYLYGTTAVGGDQGNGTVFVVNPNAAATSITLTTSPNPSTYGQTVTLTATVTSPNGPPPDGEYVVFEPVGQSPMTNGVAQFQVSDLTPGQHTLHAVYEGDLNFQYIKSAPLIQQVNQ
jgi:uncharacterized repeat protein (TIGR03803 family)